VGSFWEEEGQTLFSALIEPDRMGREKELSEAKSSQILSEWIRELMLRREQNI